MEMKPGATKIEVYALLQKLCQSPRMMTVQDALCLIVAVKQNLRK